MTTPATAAAEWLCARMIEGWRRPWAELRAELRAQPGALEAAARLIWGVFEGAGRRAAQSFRLAVEDGVPQLLTLDGTRAELPPEQPVALLHPLELDRRSKRVWLEQLDALALTQPFLQLRRPALRLTTLESNGDLLRRLHGRGLELERLDAAPWREWTGPRLESESSLARVLRLCRGPVQMSAVLLVDPETRRAQSLFDEHGQELVHLHPVLLSELLCALEQLVAPPFAALQLTLEAYAGAGQGCLGCGAQLLPEQRVLGVLRPTLEGQPRRAWAHWTCIENLPELQLAAATHDVRAELRALREGARSPAKPEPKPRLPAGEARALDEEEIFALCPDQRSISAAKKTARTRHWSGKGRAGELAWGTCAGSQRYRVAVDLGRGLTRCECQSRKRPCKHAVALMLLAARRELGDEAPPQWARSRFPDALEQF